MGTTGHRVAVLPAENLEPGVVDVIPHAAVLDEVSPCLYRIGAGGGMVLLPSADGAVPGAVRALQATGIPVLPSIADTPRAGGDRRSPAAAAVLHDRARSTRHVRAICDLIARQGHAGVDVDYQDLHGDDRAAFSGFVAHLADALHADGRRLSVTLHARDGSDDGPAALAQDYTAIGEAADEVRLATLDFHGPSTVAGPPAPRDWVRQVLGYATARVPAHKLLLGVTGSGYDWIGRRAVPVGHAQAVALAARSTGDALDPMSGNRWFRYTGADGRRHEVWFEDAETVSDKRRVAAEFGVRGVYLRLSATPDARLWSSLGGSS